MKSLPRTTSQMLACALAAVSVLAGVCSPARAPILKFSQLPMLDTRLIDDFGFPKNYHGHDELSTGSTGGEEGGADISDAFRGQMMADDFADKFTSPVVRVRWWGSYLEGPFEGVDKFLISFSADVLPDAQRPFSRPEDRPILSQVLTRGPISRGSGTFTEQLAYPLSIDGPIYEYNAELHLGQEFHQQPDTVYWLTIAALTENPDLRWGWHTRDYTVPNPLASAAPDVVPGEHFIPLSQTMEGAWHFQDDAVSGLFEVELRNGMLRRASGHAFLPEEYQTPYDGPARLLGFRGQGVSMDLAFELYTVPEPSSISLFCFASFLAIGLVSRRRT